MGGGAVLLMMLALLGCQGREPYVEAENEWIEDISVEVVSEMPTAMRVRFQSTIAGEGFVEFGEGWSMSTPIGPQGTTHEAIVLGVGPLQQVELRAVVVVDGVRHESGVLEAETGQLPMAVPLLDVTVNNYPAAASTTLLMSMYDNDRDDTVVMANLEGDVFWAAVQAEGDGFGLAVQVVDGGMWFNRFQTGKDDSIDGEVVHIDQWGAVVETVQTPDAHHYFVHEDGNTFWLRSDVASVNGFGQVIYDEIMVTDSKGQSSSLLNLLDVLDVQDSEFKQDVYDWSHANWLGYTAQRDSMLLCAGFINTILEVNQDGEVLDIFGGLNAINGEYSFDPPESAFDIPHGVHWASNGDLLMFAADEQTRSVQALRFAVDTENRVLRKVWSYGASLNREPLLLGELKELSDGNLFINWGSWGHLQIVSPEGELLWEAYTEFLVVPGQVHVLGSPYL